MNTQPPRKPDSKPNYRIYFVDPNISLPVPWRLLGQTDFPCANPVTRNIVAYKIAKGTLAPDLTISQVISIMTPLSERST